MRTSKVSQRFELRVNKETLIAKMPGVEHGPRRVIAENKRWKMVVVSTSGSVWYNNAGPHYAKAQFEIFFWGWRNETATEVIYGVDHCGGNVCWDKRRQENPYK
jgi:hypothetical protein